MDMFVLRLGVHPFTGFHRRRLPDSEHAQVLAVSLLLQFLNRDEAQGGLVDAAPQPAPVAVSVEEQVPRVAVPFHRPDFDTDHPVAGVGRSTT